MKIKIIIPKISEEEYVSFCEWASKNNVTHIDDFK